MARTHKVQGWEQYKMDYRDPHQVVEPIEREGEVVDAELVEADLLAHGRYDTDRFLAFREAVRQNFDIPWTAITPRMQRFLYAVNAIARPDVMVAVGIFCGNTFISNAGATLGPGTHYRARRLVGIEILPEEAERARQNVASVDDEGRAEILATDGVGWLCDFDEPLDLLYLDANGHDRAGKSVYLDLVQAAGEGLHPGSLVLAHNSVNAASQLADYLDYVRDPANFRESVNIVIDDQGLEVSVV